MIVLISPQGIRHALVLHQGEWHGWENLAMGMANVDKRQVIVDVLTALTNSQPLPHGFVEDRDGS